MKRERYVYSVDAINVPLNSFVLNWFQTIMEWIYFFV